MMMMNDDDDDDTITTTQDPSPPMTTRVTYHAISSLLLPPSSSSPVAYKRHQRLMSHRRERGLIMIDLMDGVVLVQSVIDTIVAMMVIIVVSLDWKLPDTSRVGELKVSP